MDYNRYNYQNNMTSGQPPERLNPFSVASFVCGIASITLCCTGVLSPLLGGLGILFAILTKRMGKAMPSMSITGLILSCVGIFLGILMCIYTFLTVPELRDILKDSYENYYDNFYEYNFEHLNDSSL